MTKGTLKTLWLTGGGMLAAWLAVSPEHTTPARASQAAIAQPAIVRELTSDSLNAQETKLRQHLGTVPLRPASRNPFRFGSKRAVDAPLRSAALAATVAPSVPAPAPQPSLSLSGIAERKTPNGPTRTAVITGDGQLYLVTEGESVGARYRVVRIDSDAVTLRDERGAETRLVLH